MPTATRRPVPMEWIALADGVAHWQPRRGQGRPVCGKPRLDARYAHPRTSKCPACEKAAS
jgi:hypothetical protein